MTTTTLTPTELAQQWQMKLSDAQRELRDFESRLGELALTYDANELAQRLNELKNAVTIAAAAEATARKAAPDPMVERKRAQLENAKKAVAESKSLAEHWGKIQQELEGPYVDAKNRCVGAMTTMTMHERAAMTYEIELNELLRRATK